jgi:hypothetical protein
MEFLGKPSVQTLPAGLLGFLGIKNGGMNPSPLLDGLQAVIDTTRWYYELATESLGTDTIAVPAGGGTTASTFSVVPAKEAWLVTSFNGVMAAQPATPGAHHFMSVLTPQNFSRKYYAAARTNPIAGELVPIYVNEPFFMGAGDAIAAGAWATASAGYNFTFAVKRVRFFQ